MIWTENPRVGAERGPVDSAPGHHSHSISNGYPMGGTRTVGMRVYGERIVDEFVWNSIAVPSSLNAIASKSSSGSEFNAPILCLCPTGKTKHWVAVGKIH